MAAAIKWLRISDSLSPVLVLFPLVITEAVHVYYSVHVL